MSKTSIKIFEQLFADKKERKIELNKTLKEAQEWGGLKPETKIKKVRFCSRDCDSILINFNLSEKWNINILI